MTVAMNIQPQQQQAPLQTHISYSQITTFLMCPMLYAHRYLYKTEQESRSVNMILGSAIHKVAEVFYRSIQESANKPQEWALVAQFEAAFSHELERSEVPLSLQDGISIDNGPGKGEPGKRTDK